MNKQHQPVRPLPSDSGLHRRLLPDDGFNRLIATGNPLMIILGVFIKYGASPILCGAMLFALYSKDKQLDYYNQQLVLIARESVKAQVESTETQKALGKLIEQNTWALKKLKREPDSFPN